MSLINQIRIALFLVIFATAAGVLTFTAFDSKHYLSENLQKKNADNANLLALSMSQMEKDQTLIDLFISAQFDIGHYRYLGLFDTEGKAITERINNNSKTTAPSWFVNFMQLNTTPGYANIQSGWQQYGTIHVESDLNFAYDRLWSGMKNMLFWVVALAVVSYIACGYLLKKILAPLNSVVEQAKAMGERRFITTPAPKTLEFKSLVEEMNILSNRIKETVNQESGRLEALRMKSHYDDLTHLFNQDYFLNMASSRILHENFNLGSAIVLRLTNLVVLNEEIGYAQTNAYLKALGNMFNTEYATDEFTFSGRLSGTDFALFIEKDTDSFAFANRLKEKFIALTQTFALATKPYAVIAATKISKVEDSRHIFKALDFILSLSSLNQDGTEVRVINANSIISAKQQYLTEWKTALTEAIKAKRIRLAHFPVLNQKDHLVHYETPVRLQLTPESDWMSAGEFIDWATELNLIDAIDQLVLESAVQSLAEEQKPICLNVSESAMKSTQYLSKIVALIKGKLPNPKLLSFEVSEIAAFNNIDQFKAFCTQIKSLGCQVGIEHMNLRISRLGELHDLGLDYIKFDSALVRNIHSNESNQTLLRGLCLVTHSMGIMTIAEGVQVDVEQSCLFEIGMDAVTGPYVSMA